MTATASDVIKGKVIVGPDGNPITGTLDFVKETSVKYCNFPDLDGFEIPSAGKYYKNNIIIRPADPSIYKRYDLPITTIEPFCNTLNITKENNKYWTDEYTLLCDFKRYVYSIQYGSLILIAEYTYRNEVGGTSKSSIPVANSSFIGNGYTHTMHFVVNTSYRLILSFKVENNKLYLKFNSIYFYKDPDPEDTFSLKYLTCYLTYDGDGN